MLVAICVFWKLFKIMPEHIFYLSFWSNRVIIVDLETHDLSNHLEVDEERRCGLEDIGSLDGNIAPAFLQFEKTG